MDTLNFNWVDYIILIIIVFYAFEGYSRGFIGAFLDLINFILSFFIGLRFYSFFADILVSQFSIPQGFSNALGFFIATFSTEVVLGILIRKFLIFEPAALKKVNKWFGIVPGILSGLIFISFILILIVSLPVASPIKNSISSSKISSLLLSRTWGLEKNLNSVFGQAIDETIDFLTVAPKSNETVSLNFKTNNLSVDNESETYMLSLVNRERKKMGLSELSFDESLAVVGRDHCSDMFRRGYFSHYTPEGLSPFDRMDRASIAYNSAGENLALSPNTDLAMKGLMESPGHRANILSSDFGRVGIGVIDGGIYGKMFCQEFRD